MPILSNNLILAERIGRLTRFVDPTKIENTFSHNSELLKRNAGKDRVRVVRNTFVQTVGYNFVGPCATGDCGAPIEDTVKVILSGASPEKTILAWESIKQNIDKAIDAHVLEGVPLNINSSDFTVITQLDT